jgi:hypothetical protein
MCRKQTSMNNEQPTPIVDSLLEEWLRGLSPRTLTTKQVREKIYSAERLAELESALHQASSELATQPSRRSASDYRRRRKHLSVGKLALAIAACLMMAFGVWAWKNSDELRSGASFAIGDSVNGNKMNAELAGPSALEAVLPQPTVPLNEPIAAAPKKPTSERQKLSLDKVPFNVSSEPAVATNKKATPSKVPPLSDSELVAAIDDHVQRWWKSNNIQPASSVDAQSWLSRATLRLVGRAPNDAEKDRFAKKSNRETQLAWLRETVDSAEFSRLWGKRLAAYYLGETVAQPNQLPDRHKDFVQWCQQELKRGPSLDAIAKSILIFEGNAKTADASTFSPSRFWWHELGSSNDQSVADFVDSRLLGRSGACERCHDGKKIPGANQEMYWGLAAVLHGIEVNGSKNDEKTSGVFYRRSEQPLFFERGDSTVVAAVPKLPNGQNLGPLVGDQATINANARKNLRSLTDWIVKSNEFAESQSNLVWEIIFGQPLVGSDWRESEVGFHDRQGLRNLLGDQLKAHAFDLKTLVVAVAASQAFSRQGIDQDGSWYANASELELQAHRTRQLLYATYPTNIDRSLRSLDRLAQWTETNNFSETATTSVLGNVAPPPNPGRAMTNANSKNAKGPARASLLEKVSKMPKGQIQYLIQSQTLPKSMSQEIDRLLKTNLSWAELVEHVYFMTGFFKPTAAEIDESNRILKVSGDRRQALFRIAAARM